MTPRMLAQLGWVFVNDANGLEDPRHGRVTFEDLKEATRLHEVAESLFMRAAAGGQRSGIAYCFGELEPPVDRSTVPGRRK